MPAQSVVGHHNNNDFKWVKCSSNTIASLHVFCQTYLQCCEHNVYNTVFNWICNLYTYENSRAHVAFLRSFEKTTKTFRNTRLHIKPLLHTELSLIPILIAIA